MNCRDCEHLERKTYGVWRCRETGAHLSAEDLEADYDCPRTLKEKGATKGSSYMAEVAQHYKDRELEMLRAWLRGDTGTEISSRVQCPKHVVSWYIEKFEREAKLVAEKWGLHKAAIREFMKQHGRKPTVQEAMVLFGEKGLEVPRKKVVWYILWNMAQTAPVVSEPVVEPEAPVQAPTPQAETRPEKSETEAREPERKAEKPETPKQIRPTTAVPREPVKRMPATKLVTVVVADLSPLGAGALIRGVAEIAENLPGPLHVRIDIQGVMAG